MRNPRPAALTTMFVLVATGCADSGTPSFVTPAVSAPAAREPGPAVPPPATASKRGVARLLPRPGNPDGRAVVPAEAAAVDSHQPSRVIGTGTTTGCTSDAVVEAVAAGGIITFDCGPAPVTITMTRTAKVSNAASAEVVLDGGGKVTLSGGGKRRILYLNTCDRAQGVTTDHCLDQDHPRLTLQNLVLADGRSTGEGGGGAVFVHGGRVKVVDTRFADNRCDPAGPAVGGAAMRVLSQSGNQPVYVVRSSFTGGACSNGGALSSVGVSWVVLNSVFSGNRAVGRGASPPRAGTPGGGSGGAIQADGNTFTVTLSGTVLERNRAAEAGGAVFFVSHDRTGTLLIEGSSLRANRPGIVFQGASPSATPAA